MAFLSRSALLGAAVAAFSPAVIALPAWACGTEAYVGEVCIMAGTYCPSGTAEAEGQMIATYDNTALFSLIGCEYGGDCRNTMTLPDLRGRTPTGYGTGPGLTGHAFAQYYGQEEVEQTLAQLPPHSHAATFVPNGGGSPGTPVEVRARQSNATTNVPQTGYMLGQPTYGLDPVNLYLSPSATPGADVDLGGVSGGGGGSSGGVVIISSTGAGQALPIVPPRLAMRYCIVTQGLYPPRG